MKYHFIETKYFGRREIIILPDDNIWTPNICPKCGGNHVTASIPAVIEIKGVPCDFYENSGKLFISSNCLKVFQQLELTGYKVQPVQVKSKNNKLCSTHLEYYELIIEGRCGYAMNTNHEFLPKCNFCGRRLPLKESVSGLSFNESDYDGSSIFSYNNLTNYPIVCDTIKKMLIKAKLSNIKFTELSQMTMI